MKKNIYFGACIFSAFLLYILGSLNVHINLLTTVGFLVIIGFAGVILHDLQDLHHDREKAEEAILIRLYKAENLLHLLRNTQPDNINTDHLSSTAIAETLKIIGELCTKLKETQEKQVADAVGEGKE